MKTFDIGDSLKRGWELFKNNKKVLILTTLIYVIAGAIMNVDGGEDVDINFGFFPILFILGVLAYLAQQFIQLGWFKTLLKIEDGLNTNVKEMFSYKSLFWKYLGTSILYMIIMIVGFILLIIPGVYFMLKYIFAPIIVIDKNVSIREAFDHSKTLTANIKWKIFVFIVLIGFINLLGLLLIGVGLLVTLPVTTLALLHVYRTLSQEISPAVVQEPASVVV